MLCPVLSAKAGETEATKAGESETAIAGSVKYTVLREPAEIGNKIDLLVTVNVNDCLQSRFHDDSHLTLHFYTWCLGRIL